MEQIGARIKRNRKFKGLTQEQLAQQAGISVMSIRRYESGTRNANEDVIRRIADALNMEWYELCGDSPQEQSKAIKEHIKAMLRGEKTEDSSAMPTERTETSIPERIGAALDKLNDDGQQEAAKRVEELTEVPRYQQPAEPQDEQPDVDE